MARNPREPYDAPAQFEPAPSGVSPLQVQAPDFRGLSSTLDQWQREEQAKLEKKAVERQQQIATRQQREAGTDELVEPPDVADRFQRAHQAQAQEVLNQQIQADATVKASELRNKHFNDPEGFRQEWEAWKEGQFEAFRDQDPQFADELALGLEERGTNQYVRLADQVAARERRNQAAKIAEARQQQLRAGADDLLNDPDQQKYEELKFKQLQSIESQYEMGLMGAAEREKARNNIDTTMDREFLRGRFLNSLDRGDVAGATGIVKSLLQGNHFEQDPTNQENRRLANELMGMLKERQPDYDIGAHMDKLDRAENLVSEGGDNFLSDEDLAMTGELVNRFGTADQKRKFAAKARSLRTMEYVNQQLPEVPFNQLPQFKDQVINSASPYVPEDATDRLLKQIQDRQNQIAEAKQTQDYASISWKEGMTLDSVSPDQLQQRRRRNARVAGVSVDEVGLLPKSVIKDYSQRLQKARGAGAVDDVARLSNDLVEAYGGDRQALLGDLEEWEQRGGGDVALPLMLDTLGNRDSSARLSQVLTLGNAFSNEDMQESNPKLVRAQIEKDLFQEGPIADVVNNFYGARRSNMKDTVAKAYRGLAEGEQLGADEAEDELVRLLRPLSESFTYDTGDPGGAVRMPESLLNIGSEYDRRRIKKDIEEKFNNPVEAFGLSPNNSTLAQDFRVEIAPGGRKLQFRIPQTNELVRDRNQDGETDDVVRNEAGEPVTVPLAPKRPPEESAPPAGFKENLAAELEEFGNMMNDLSGAANRQGMVNQSDAPEETVNAIWHATDATPPETGGNDRVSKYFLPAEIEGRYDDEVVGEMPPLYSEVGARVYAIKLSEEVSQAFPDDPEAQLAAYWFGDPDFVKDLKEGAGDQWTQALAERDMDAYQFVQRGVDQYSEENMTMKALEKTPHKAIFDFYRGAFGKFWEGLTYPAEKLRENNPSMRGDDGEE